MELPQALVAQFRSGSLERLDRIEAGWNAVTQRMATAELEAEMFRDVHTLKGEARLVGFADVVLITERLEDLLFAARRRRFRVHEDVDVVVTMALQFLRMLLRKRAGGSQGGIDLAGFLKHIDEVLTEWPRQSETLEGASGPSSLRAHEGTRVSAAVRQRLGIAAALVFLESRAGLGSTCLERAWEVLVDELSRLDAVELMPLVRRHAVAAKDLAVELGKEVDVVIDGPDLRVSAEVVDTIHTSLLHTLRNAVDHGIETPDQRAARGKPRRGTINLHITAEDQAVRLEVEDDGDGADLESIRRRAIELALLSPEGAKAATDDALLELVFVPGFTVRESASSVSGRGIGMDAVRSTIERMHGTISIRSQKGVGATVTMRLPRSQNLVDVYAMPSTRKDVLLAVPTTWTLRRDADGPALDPLVALGLRPQADGTGPFGVAVLTRDGDEHAILTGGPPAHATALRICPTSADEPFEIVQIESREAILIRPEIAFARRSVS